MKSFLNKLDKLDKLAKERKLLLIEPSNPVKNSYIEKSESNLISSKILLRNNQFEESVALTYYRMYSLVLALLFATGIKCEKHSAGAIIAENFNRDLRAFILALNNQKIEDYRNKFQEILDE